MIERIDDMPTGTIGFRAQGVLTKEDYVSVLEPVLREAIDGGEVRMLFELASFDGLEPGAWTEDVKTGLGLGVGHHAAWKRSAIATDIGWLAKAFEMFAWMTPGEVKLYPLAQVEEARNWITG